jgi:hypothetical protein
MGVTGCGKFQANSACAAKVAKANIKPTLAFNKELAFLSNSKTILTPKVILRNYAHMFF